MRRMVDWMAAGWALLGLGFGILATAGCAAERDGQPTESEQAMADGSDELSRAPDGGERDAGVLGYTVRSIDGAATDLSQYLGDVVLIVNTASECGFTPQYEGLQALYEEKRDAGFVVLGFPANDFMGQEPGTDAQIAAFCSQTYGVSFPMFSKVSVVGGRQHPLFAELSEQSEPPNWNFTKYLVGPDGRLVARYGPRTVPSDKTLRAEIDRLLTAG